MTDQPYHSGLSLGMRAKVELEERLDSTEACLYPKITLLRSEEDITVEFQFADDEDYDDTRGFVIQLTAYHKKNPETERFFHVDLTAFPTRADIQKIRGYCDFLLTLPSPGDV